jgi:hypothetical protein
MSSLMSSYPHKISSNTPIGSKLHHIRILNIRHFGAIDVTLCHHLHRKFQLNPSISSNIIRGSFNPPQKFKRPPFWNEDTRLSSMEYRSS